MNYQAEPECSGRPPHRQALGGVQSGTPLPSLATEMAPALGLEGLVHQHDLPMAKFFYRTLHSATEQSHPPPCDEATHTAVTDRKQVRA